VSATGRGKPREASDLYPTDERITLDFLRRCPLPPGVWWEPACGDGAIVRAVESWRPGAQTWGLCDVREEAVSFAQVHSSNAEIAAARCADFTDPMVGVVLPGEPAVIITNPPFSIAEDFARTCFLRSTPITITVLLLRVGFVGSTERRGFWQEYPRADVYPIVPRPSFGLNKEGKPGTDASEYAWFVWGPKTRGIVHHAEQPWRAGRERRATA
jgi:hypothetical protein